MGNKLNLKASDRENTNKIILEFNNPFTEGSLEENILRDIMHSNGCRIDGLNTLTVTKKTKRLDLLVVRAEVIYKFKTAAELTADICKDIRAKLGMKDQILKKDIRH